MPLHVAGYSTDFAELLQIATNEFQKLLLEKGYGEIQTKIKPLERFYVAEEYHQDYIRKNPNGYCPDHSTGVRFAQLNEVPAIDNSELFWVLMFQFALFESFNSGALQYIFRLEDDQGAMRPV